MTNRVEVAVRLVGIHHTQPGGNVALRGVDLDVAPGGPTVLRGPNGAGKSTLLRIAAGVEMPTAGRVEDRPAVVGYLPDRFPALLRIPPRRWLDHMAQLRRLDVDEVGDRSDALLEELGYDGADDEPMSALSKGNAQKIGLAQALACEPGVLVLDEPWSGLDDEAADALTARIAARGGPTLLTDHSGTAAVLPGARLHRIEDGELSPDPDSQPLPAAPPADVVMRIDLACAGDPRAVLDRLPPVPVEGVGRGRMIVLVPAPQSDAWLAAALASGCAVRSVRPVRPTGRDAPPQASRNNGARDNRPRGDGARDLGARDDGAGDRTAGRRRPLGRAGA
ncbi:ATP-binding cassette domain-containing protein [Pseudonocardia phyllosphaerae]|uniref:ATP-binding cassette domain-containing protein n=1 Tax=Pseudonocardia phyllosphaerae TaxID=3390502 RepID=UPI003978664D